MYNLLFLLKIILHAYVHHNFVIHCQEIIIKPFNPKLTLSQQYFGNVDK